MARYLLLLCCFFILPAAKAQQVAVWEREDLTEALQYSGDTVYVFNFWATWCKPCVEELPHFREVREEWQDRPVRFVFISLDFLSKRESALLPFVSRKLNGEDVVQLNAGNPNDWIPLVDSSWSGAIPATLFRSPRGRIFKEEGLTKAELQQTLEMLIPR